MKDFFISVYETLGIQGIIILVSAILILVIEVVNAQHIKEINETNRGIQNELQYLRQDKSLKEQGKGYYR